MGVVENLAIDGFMPVSVVPDACQRLPMMCVCLVIYVSTYGCMYVCMYGQGSMVGRKSAAPPCFYKKGQVRKDQDILSDQVKLMLGPRKEAVCRQLRQVGEGGGGDEEEQRERWAVSSWLASRHMTNREGRRGTLTRSRPYLAIRPRQPLIFYTIYRRCVRAFLSLA
jgi:hypothetical protein